MLFRYPPLALACFLAFFPASTNAQPSHAAALVEAYKAQNPHAVKTPRPTTENAANRNVDYVAPPPNAPEIGLLRDPLGRPDQIVHIPFPNEGAPNIVQTAYGSVPPQGRRAPVGNPRDPFNTGFRPIVDAPTSLAQTPYDEMLLDARLNDVFFLNPTRGWAVGDRGVIWTTTDAGKTWTQQATPIDCPLRSVHFFNEHFGFAVGGYQIPFTKQGRGVVLTTANGGQRWTLLETPSFPSLHKVRIFDPMRFWVGGEASELYPSGIIQSDDGGRRWKAMDGGKSEGWNHIDLYDEKNGFGIGTQGTLLMVRHSPKLSQTPSFGASRINGLKLDSAPNSTVGWLVGEKGLILSTNDRGLRWGATLGTLPGNAATTVDLNTLETQSKIFWVAGNPGTFIYTSADQGKTWKGTPTGVEVPIRKLFFVDAKNGFAVGDLGTILATNDGGASWQIQRNGGKRLAVLGLFGRAEEIPYEVFVRLCAEQGYLGGAMLIFRETAKQSDNFEALWLHRVHEAMLRCGAVGVWETGMFTLDRDEFLSSPEQIIKRLEQENDGKGLKMLQERLVAAIRQWKPDVVFASGLGSGKEKDAVREFVLREVVEAIKQAEDPKAFPHQQTELGLAPWKVKKIHLKLPDGTLGDVNLQTMEGSSRLGQSYDEMAYLSRGLTEGHTQSQSAILGFSTAKDECPPSPNRDFFSGLIIPPGSESRRALIGSYVERWQEVQALIQYRRHSLGILQNLSTREASNGRQAANIRLAANASELLRKVDQDVAVRTLLDMGRQFAQNGDWDSAVDAFNLVVEQHSQHPLVRDAFRWLIQYYASAETNWRLQQKNTVTSRVAARTESGMLDATQINFGSDRQVEQSRWNRAASMGQYLAQTMPDLANDPRLRFSLASMQIRSGNGFDSLRFFQTRGRAQYDDVWGTRAKAEYWLSIENRDELPPEMLDSPLPIIRCAWTPTKPYLDGRFEKDFDQGTWFNAKLYPLTPEKPRKRLSEMLKNETKDGAPGGLRREEQSLVASKKFGTQVMFMYDQDHLYIGLRCKRVAGFSYPPVADKPRIRDANIDDQDRVEILLDIDRDYGTYYSLTFDSRGWLVDSCWGDTTWNPRLHVARDEDKDFWYIETAIPLESLTDRFPMPKTVWAVGLRRIVPGQGIECWNAENSFDLTEGLGLLVFD